LARRHGNPEPRAGAGLWFRNQADAVTWASLSGRACGIIELENRHYIYELNHDYSLSAALASGFERRTGIVTSGSIYVVIVTSDAAVLRPRDARYFAGSQFESPTEGLEGAERVLGRHGEDLTGDQALRLFRQMVRDLVFANLERSRQELRAELDRFFTVPGISMAAFLRPAGEELQRDTAALRRHVMHAVTLADAMREDAPENERADLRETLAAIGRIHERDPSAALILQRNREDDATGPAPEERLRGGRDGQDGRRCRVGVRYPDRTTPAERRARPPAPAEEPRPVLDLTPLHEQLLLRFSPAQAAKIQADFLVHDLGQLTRPIGITVADLAVFITGTIVGNGGSTIDIGSARTSVSAGSSMA
jgi:hypothetical protein